MGFADAAGRVVFFGTTVIVSSTVFLVALPAARDMIEAQDERHDLDAERAATALLVTALSYDAQDRLLTVTARNEGDAVVEVDRMTAVVDGVALTGVTAEVGGQATEILGRGDTATLYVPEVASVPDRVMLVADQGTRQVVELGDAAATAAGVGMYVGAGGNESRYFHSLSVGASGTTVSGVFKTKNAADTTVQDVVRIYNSGSSTQTVLLTGPNVPNATAEVFTWTVKNGGTTVATLDHRAASPSASFNLPAGSTYRLTLRLDLAEGSGRHNAQFDFGLTLGVN